MENFPEVKGNTRDIAAKASGFGNGKTDKAHHQDNQSLAKIIKLFN
ncbi:hypothetical protein [Orbus hercynius]|nr:hypothetical protein [Orbus hercynius]